MSEHDQRQFKLMSSRIEDYEAGHLPLGGLIGDLEFLRTALEKEDAEWDRQYLTQLGALEECYAVMLDEERSALTVPERLLVSEAIDSLKDLLSEKSSP